MSLSSLPWFIRREVINFIIEDNPEYSSISREWMRQVAIRHGEVRLEHNIPDSRPISPFSPYIERINFHRSTNIDWDTLLLYKNLKHVKICFFYDEVENYTEFTSKLETLPPLSNLQLLLPENRNIDITNVLEKGKDHFEKLELVMYSIKRYPFNLIFSKLKNLYLSDIRSQFLVQDITRNIPSLYKLYLNCDLGFSDEVMKNIVELDVKYSQTKPNAKLELSLFPQLKQLKVNGILLTSLESHQNQIESLIIHGTANQIMQIRNITFSNLKDLELCNNENEKFQDLESLFQHLVTLTTLIRLSLSILEETDLPSNLTEDSYSFTDLTLQGPFLITPHSLTCLSKCFKLTRLILEFCVLKNDVKLPIVPFEALESLKITPSRFYISNFESHFNQVNYPHVKITVFDQFRQIRRQNPHHR